MNVGNIYDLIDAVAPFSTQLEYDNSGLLVGSREQEVTGILFALDVTDRVIDEAVSLGVQLIVTHHPLMFHARRRLTDEDYEGRILMRLVREGISMIAAHTSLDQAPGGINDALAEVCGLQNCEGEGFIRVGELPGEITAADLRDALSAALHTTVRMMGDPDMLIREVGLCSGGGSDEWEKAAALGAEAFISGEIKHHDALAMADRGIVAYECGHYATEVPGIFALADALQSALNQVEYDVEIYVSSVEAYASPLRKP